MTSGERVAETGYSPPEPSKSAHPCSVVQSVGQSVVQSVGHSVVRSFGRR